MDITHHTNKQVSIINDPFKKDCINEINISMDLSLFHPHSRRFRGYVKFKNGQTEGTQRFTGDDLADVFMKVKAFVETL